MALKKLKVSEAPVPVTIADETIPVVLNINSGESLPVEVNGNVSVDPIVVQDSADHPTLLNIPDEVDTTDGSIIYLGYVSGSEYLIARRVISGSTISTTWANGDWSDREILFPSV